jgi:hypothetical protein
MHKLRASIIIFCILLFSLPVYGQKLINSPFSRFNIGSLEPAGSFRSIAMGGVGIAIRDNSSIYYLNPASYSSIDTTSFVFDFGLDYGMATLSEDTSSHFSGDMNFDHLMFGFPVAKGLGISAGIIPFSNGYYKIVEEVTDQDPEYNEQTGEYVSIHKGAGSISKLFFGAGLKLTEYFSVGANMTVLFGDISRSNQILFNDYYNVFHNNSSEKLHLAGVNLEYGAQLMLPLEKDFFINAGLSVIPGKNYNSDYQNLIYLFSAYGSVDTLSYISDAGKALIPGTLRAGISFGKINKFTAGFDYIQTKWSESTVPGIGSYFADTKSFKFGIEFIPEKYSIYSFLNRVEYRIGGHFEDNYLILNGEQVKEIGASLGLGIPLRRTRSKTNIFFDYTKRYCPNGSVMPMENIFSIGASLNLYDMWFMQRKYD